MRNSVRDSRQVLEQTMNDKKRSRSGSPRPRRKAFRYRRVLRFPQIKGKAPIEVELSVSRDDYAITLKFEDKTCLSFDIEPCVTVRPDLSDWKSGDAKLIKQWRPIHSKSSRL